ncbi:MAG: DUF4340 domain-containing protein [Candidatus Zipacnadales bacterium]
MRTMKRAGIAAAVLALVGIMMGLWVLTKEVVFPRDDKGKIQWDQTELIDRETNELFAFHQRDITAIDITVREVDYSDLDKQDIDKSEDEEEPHAQETSENINKNKERNQTNKEANTSDEEPKKEVKERRLGLARVDGKWMLTAPLHALADQDAAEGLAKAIADLTINGKIEGVDPLEPKYGLNNPSVIAKVKRKGGKELEIRIGRDTKIGSDVYLMVVGTPKLYNVSSSVKTSLVKEPKDLREKTVVEFDKEAVKRLILDAKGARIVCEQVGKKDAREWWLSQPVRARAQDFAVTDAIDKVKNLEAKEFVDEVGSLAQYGLDKPSIVARLEFGKGKDDVVVRFGKRISKKLDTDTSYSTSSTTSEQTKLVYCMADGRDEVFLVEANILDSLEKDPIDFRDTTIVEFETTKVKRVTIERKRGVDFELVKADAKWRIEKPEFANADNMKVDDLLWDLKDLKAVDFLDNKQVSANISGLASPAVSVSVYTEGEDEPLVIKFGYQDKESTNYYCQTSKMRSPCLVSDTWKDILPEKVDDIKEKSTSDEDKAKKASGDKKKSSAGATDKKP